MRVKSEGIKDVVKTMLIDSHDEKVIVILCDTEDGQELYVDLGTYFVNDARVNICQAHGRDVFQYGLNARFHFAGLSASVLIVSSGIFHKEVFEIASVISMRKEHQCYQYDSNEGTTSLVSV